MLPSNDPDSVLVNAFCCFDPSQDPNHIQRFAETLCERFWHAFKSNKFQPNLRFDSAACQKGMVLAVFTALAAPIVASVQSGYRRRRFPRAAARASSGVRSKAVPILSSVRIGPYTRVMANDAKWRRLDEFPS